MTFSGGEEEEEAGGMEDKPSYVLTASRFITCLMTWYSSLMPFPPNMSLDSLAASNALPQEFLLMMEIISGVALMG